MTKLVFIQAVIVVVLVIMGFIFSKVSDETDSLGFYSLALVFPSIGCGITVSIFLQCLFLQGVI